MTTQIFELGLANHLLRKVTFLLFAALLSSSCAAQTDNSQPIDLDDFSVWATSDKFDPNLDYRFKKSVHIYIDTPSGCIRNGTGFETQTKRDNYDIEVFLWPGASSVEAIDIELRKKWKIGHGILMNLSQKPGYQEIRDKYGISSVVRSSSLMCRNPFSNDPDEVRVLFGKDIKKQELLAGPPAAPVQSNASKVIDYHDASGDLYCRIKMWTNGDEIEAVDIFSRSDAQWSPPFTDHLAYACLVRGLYGGYGSVGAFDLTTNEIYQLPPDFREEEYREEPMRSILVSGMRLAALNSLYFDAVIVANGQRTFHARDKLPYELFVRPDPSD